MFAKIKNYFKTATFGEYFGETAGSILYDFIRYVPACRFSECFSKHKPGFYRNGIVIQSLGGKIRNFSHSNKNSRTNSG